MKNRVTVTFLSSLILLSATCNLAFAEDDGWNFMVSPMFLWGKSIEGTQQIGPSSSELNLKFKDEILENLAAAFTLHFEASKNDLTLFADYQYSKLDPSVETNLGPVIDIDLKDQSVEFGAGYRVATFGINDLHVIGGARYKRQDMEVTLNPGPGLGLFDIRDHWWDGFIGLRIFTHISDNLTFIGRGDVATGGSDIAWNISALIDYQFKDWGSVFAGYKWLDYDYDNEEEGADRFVFDVTEQGPVAGLAIYF